MIKDQTKGRIEAFRYAPARTPRDRRVKRNKTIRPEGLTSFPLGEAPPVGAPLSPPLRGDKTGSESSEILPVNPRSESSGDNNPFKKERTVDLGELTDEEREAFLRAHPEWSKFLKG